MMLPRMLLLIATLTGGALASAQEVIVVGKGSYAAQPPLRKVMDTKKNIDLVAETEQRPLYIHQDQGQPIPSNKWYQNLLFQQYGTGLWAMPHKVDATAEGIELYYPTQPSSDGTRFVAEFPLILTGKDFKPTDSRAKTWSDWMVSFRMPASEQQYLDVTLGQGMPYVWAEFKGLEPRLAFGGKGGKGSRGKNEAQFFDLAGQNATLPFTGDAIGIVYEGKHYGVFAPPQTRFTGDGTQLTITFAGTPSYLVLAPLPALKDLGRFRQYAFAVPRDTKLTWDYNRSAGTLSTHWEVSTELLQGNEKRVLQGWLPHHWRENTRPLQFVDIDYSTIRGKLRCTAGNNFTISYPFQGILPNLPLPNGADFKGDRMQTYLTEHFALGKKGFAADTYWGGKDLQRFTQAAFMAGQMRDPSFTPIAKKVRQELENWLTYTPGEKDHYFAYYPRRKGLIGFNTSFGSQHFTDHHFHNGYFVFSAGLLSHFLR